MQAAFKLCYDLLMMVNRLNISIVALLCVLAQAPAWGQVAVTPAWAQLGGDQLAAELNKLRQQQRQLERDINQYEESIILLQSSDNLGSPENTSAQETLEKQLRQSRQALLELSERETALLQKLLPGQAGATDTDSTPVISNPDAEEVARLKALLAKYYADEARAEEEEAATEAAALAGTDGGPFPTDKVRLSGVEGVAAIQQISERLAETAFEGQRRELDIIYHIEVRRGQSLVSSGSHSLKSLGNSQFVSKVSLAGGSATVTVRKDAWKVELDPEDASDYLITLNLPRDGAPELHIIPVRELKETRWTELPPWLPYIGTIPPAPAGP